VRLRLVTLLAAVAAALVLAACGSSGGDDGGSGADPASAIPGGSPVFIEATLRPDAQTAEDVDALAQAIAGVDDVGGLIVEELEDSAAEDAEPFDYAEDVEPWLGERAGLFLDSYDGEDFHEGGFALETTDGDAAQEFIDKFVKADADGEVEDGSYEGVDYKIESSDGEAVGMIGDLLAFAETERSFKAMVDASEGGEALAGEAAYEEAIGAVPSGSLADVFVDIGELIDQAGEGIDPDSQLFLETAGLEPDEATAVASVVPGSDQIEIELSTDVTEGDASFEGVPQLLGSLPAGSFAALGGEEFGKRFGEAIDEIDAQGIPGELPPNKLKSTLKEAGIDLESIASSLGDIAVFAEGNSERTLGGAVVLEAKDAQEAKNTVSNVGLFLRAADVSGVTAIDSGFSGFSIRDAELGSKPLVVGVKGEKIAIAYGPKAATAALSGGAGTLADNATYKEAVAALGDTPITGFVNGPPALTLANGLIPADDEDFQGAKPYLEKITFVAIGGGQSGDRSTATLVVGVK
jgi:Protein of unknown function (DUF3352)